MAAKAEVLGVHLATGAGLIRAGTLLRDGLRSTAFVPDEAYLRDDARPMLSLSWEVPGDPEQTRARLASRGDKIGLHGGLPPWFAGLLPEGALRELVDAEMGSGDHDAFDLLARLGADLPGAVVVIPDGGEPPPGAGDLRWERVEGFQTVAPVAQGRVKFSLAGVQLKFTAQAQGERLSAPARAGEGRQILKLGSAQYPDLPEAEYSAMTLAARIGVQTAPCRLVPVAAIDGIPPEFLVGDTAYLVERFDRTAEGRVHIEDMAQILGASGERKYTMGNTETVLRMISRFSTDWRGDVLEGFRRVVADVLLGNGDSHLKNWSFIFPEPGLVRLSSAYDIVPTILYNADDDLALRFAGARTFDKVTLHRMTRVAEHLGLEAGLVTAEVVRAVRAARDLWPETLATLPLAPAKQQVLLARLNTLPLALEALAL